MLPSQRLVRGPHTVQPQEASDNGERLLDLASAHNLVLANTLFEHKRVHLYTHQLAPRQNQPGIQRVIDYILCSSRFRSSIRDCRVFRGVAGSDHRLLVCTLQLRLSSARQQPAARRAAGPSRFAVSRLQQRDVLQQFTNSMHNRFAALADSDSSGPAAAVPDAEAEWLGFMQATQETAAAELGPQPRRRHNSELPQRLGHCVKLKHEAYAAWQQKEQQWRQLQQEQAAQGNAPCQHHAARVSSGEAGQYTRRAQ